MIAGLTLCCSVFMPATIHAQTMEKEHMDKMKDGSVMMKDGKMMEMKDGNWVAQAGDKTMTNGARVMTNGTVVMKDGTKKMLTNGDCVKPDGMMHKKMEKKM